MPREFYARARTIKTFTLINLFCLLSSIVSVCLSFELLLTRGLDLLILPFILIVLLCVILMVWVEQRTRFLSKDLDPYYAPLFFETKEYIVSVLGAININDEIYASTDSINGYSARILVQDATHCNYTELSKQRKKANQVLNKRYGTQQEVPLYSALKMIRVNLLICNEDSESLHQYLSNNIGKLLSRNEVVIPVAAVINEQKILYPKCPANLTLNQLSRYVAVADYLIEKFSTEQ